jgi:putative toxin-antitoxin system antitoxin component (TIGR02293 family)
MSQSDTSIAGLPAPADVGDMRLISAVRQGLAVQEVDDVLASGRLSAVELDRLALPRKTLNHRRSLGRLSPEQSDRLVRLLRMIGQAEEVFGNAAKAHRWLRLSTAALSGNAPLDLLDTEIGARQVETLLGRIAHGIAA